MPSPEDAPFALCLTHDVDRPSLRAASALYHAVADRSLAHLRGLWPGVDPYRQFETVRALERDLGVRSAFYVLDAPHLLARPPRSWLRPVSWVQHLGRYDPTAEPLASEFRRLAADGWEVGLHGSLPTATDRGRLAAEKATLEGVLGQRVRGCRQHYLRLDEPDTWRAQAAVGLDYDASLGSSTEYGFQHGYRPRRPFDDDFLVFPLTAMEAALPDPGEDFERAWAACEDLLAEAAANDAVMTVLWHPRLFSEAAFPGYRRLYRRLVRAALDRGAWVGPPGDCYDAIVGADGTGRPAPAERPARSDAPGR